MLKTERESGSDSQNDNSDLEQHDRKHAGSGPTPPDARFIHEVIREDGEKELKRTLTSISSSALGAGLSMGFSFFTMAILRSGLPEAPWTKLITSFGYTIGFLIVVLGRQQLFTESTLTAILPLLTRRDARTTYRVARLWTIVLVGNILGTFIFAWLISHEALFQPDLNKALRTLAEEAVKDPFWPMLIKAILAGWLIALMVWLIPGAGQARLQLVTIITYVVAAAHFSHIIAGSVEAAFNVFTGHLMLPEYFTRFMAPTLIGNTIGGASLVAVLNHAPLKGELANRARERRSHAQQANQRSR